jgi:predicted nuclease of restriction endonuclease-like (RecB) superfamily
LKHQFSDIIHLIKESRTRAIRAVNAELIDLYWNIGSYISEKINHAEWGESVVEELSNFIQQNEPNLKGFSDKNLWRMKQFFEAYKEFPKLSPVVRELSWTHNLIIISRTKSLEERTFYLNLCKQERYSKRELERQISASIFERTILGNTNNLLKLNDNKSNVINTFRDSYVFEFLNLNEPYKEKDLQKGLIREMKNFILEIGKDFIFIDEEFKIQVGKSDFFIDLLFYHRTLQCLIAFELKTDKFKPEHLGQLNFYLEALDNDVKKNNENPSIGILICKDKDNEVVEYALNRSLSTTLVAEYQTKLPNKKLLQEKLHDLFENNE